ncbi:MAG TPA: LCP family protein [Nocardioides sp.]|uniref:LCP family protein n=1 Tax=uncultured Nocardioides sp. TaxID=198441 RepID=UPI000EF0E515|nr:LCP family protein [uncultured Nocardioides sp.]HCB06320.1 LytR family transcriptional regulator [Nocardioides sp.]HRD59661.1 LCP family protein [Nocardioides sp.]HRI95231.1 LCP family protein [Nocardioides sp.]HRK47421.1 LCP family protein [Nocardioides sp.]
MTRRHVRRGLKLVVLALVVAICAAVAPESSVKPTDLALVKIKSATSVDVSPDVVWIMAVGSDARPGEDMTHTRGDALQLIGLNTKTGAAAAIGVPRDSWVAIPGVGNDKINAALYYGGPELLAETVGNLVGIQPDYVFVTRFEKFKNMVNGIGGIDVHNPIYFDDTYLKPLGFEPGKIHLNGYLALAFSRIRHNLLRGDFDRSANQQRVLEGIQAKIRERASRPGWIEAGVLSAIENMATDASPSDLYRLARAAAAVKPSKITTCVVQGGIGDIGGASVVLPYTDQAARLGDLARTDATLESCD